MVAVDGMADNFRNGPIERDIEQAITALKKGAQLLKYGRRGKPKFCPFRLSNDETTLIWFSGKEEKQLRLSSVSRIVPGQRTPNFQRYPRPEKDYQSFSLIYSNTDRSLDLICKDKDEAEVWFVGLKALVPGGQMSRLKLESKNEGVSSSDITSPATWTRVSPLGSPFSSTENLQQDGDLFKLHTPYGSPPRQGLEKRFSAEAMSSVEGASTIGSLHSVGSDIGSDTVNAQMRVVPMDPFRVSLSSAVSSSSQGSGHEEGDALGDVFIWGEGVGEGFLGGGVHRIGSIGGGKMDALLPKALESAVMLDVHNIACGSRHAALVTKHGEVFSWGEESGGRLGHGVDVDVSHPCLVESLATTNTEFVACGEYHTCAVTLSGELYSWGDATHSVGLLGHGNDISHWMPKRVNSLLEGVRVSSIACGPFHTALVSSAGQLFTFGDGTFGVLGHGDTANVSCPKEVESLKGLKTVRVACGAWHTAAVVEVMAAYSTGGCSSGKLFTWGDGDKGRLGHGDRERKLVPTCLAALVDYNFRQVACGHTLTVALSTSGRVFTIGSTAHGQLGDPQADGKVPALVEGRLREAFVEEISCGAFHVAVLTAKTEVYTWGKGANGRLGHGDLEDRNSPTLVEALKDKQVKGVACGAGFTAAVCLHKWVSGADQSICSGCRQPFAFTRKRHNCYNCGLAFCHPCSGKKALKASLAPNPNKPYRVCEPCSLKLKKAAESVSASHLPLVKRSGMMQRSAEATEKTEKQDSKVPKPQFPLAKGSGFNVVKQGEGKGQVKRSKKHDITMNSLVPAVNNLLQWGIVDFPTTLNPLSAPSKAIVPSSSVPPSRAVSRPVSPLSRRPSPPRSTTPTPTLMGLTSPKTILDDLKRANDALTQEVVKLRGQVESLVHKNQQQEVELQKSGQRVQEAIGMAQEETAKCQAAKEVIKSLTAQLKDMAERLPAGAYRQSKQTLSSLYHYDVPNGLHTPAAVDALAVTVGEDNHYNRLGIVVSAPNQRNIDLNGVASPRSVAEISNVANFVSMNQLPSRSSDDESNRLEMFHTREERPKVSTITRKENGRASTTEWVEQDQSGVYITLTVSPNGGRELKRVRFSRKRFSEKEAEQWWLENRQRVHEQYDVRSGDKGVPGTSSISRSEDGNRNSLQSAP
ncbi:hypothetical protein O6H91_05G088700 [Diphasiastrum complanatum]|uniref:Uncharacterized protein n=3 Tax=Diphasiastrum complanatum TaxID=34168 RepID=A0ACC2DQJ0_DIPCM|nr:hypothetical protein O6H91_05G088700 [Diphasiastrum complanatum]KAJ7556572.1 hypothetical protein O6H91_05G088700 [Diphasiastrum complanatum]KAJ7556573.1 hypothetical protein O6H91_05G088700 [Diphasiastrum complanatum]